MAATMLSMSVSMLMPVCSSNWLRSAEVGSIWRKRWRNSEFMTSRTLA